MQLLTYFGLDLYSFNFVYFLNFWFFIFPFLIWINWDIILFLFSICYTFFICLLDFNDLKKSNQNYTFTIYHILWLPWSKNKFHIKSGKAKTLGYKFEFNNI